MLVNSQLFASGQSGFFTLLCSFLIICFQLFEFVSFSLAGGEFLAEAVKCADSINKVCKFFVASVDFVNSTPVVFCFSGFWKESTVTITNC